MKLAIISCIVIFLSRLSLADVLGIDFGSEFVKVAKISPGKSFEIVLDGASKRAHPQLVVFDSESRVYGTSATSLVSRRPANAFLQFSRLLGKNINSPVIEDLRNRFIFTEVIPDEERNTLRLVLDANVNYTVEEITGMALRHCKRIAEAGTEREVKDSVITVPEFYTHKERQALLDAAQLAGLNVLSLINENTAAALQYALSKEYATNKTETLLFFNMGATSTKASAIRYSAYAKSITRTKNKTIGQFEVLATSWDERLGGFNFDKLLINSLIGQVKEQLLSQAEEAADKKAIASIETNPRVMARLRSACAKAKKILSANQETRVRVESIFKDFDFSAQVSRDDLVSLASEAKLFYRAEKVLDDVVNRSKIEKGDFDAIVVIGGSTRIPRLKEVLNNYLGTKVREDINADEASALGAAFRAANLSSAYRVRPVGMVDVTNIGASVRITDLKPNDNLPKPFSKRGSLFSDSNRLHKRRSVAFKHAQDLRAVLKYDSSDRLPLGTSNKLPRFNVTGLKDAVEKYVRPKYNVTDMPKVSLAFLLDASGVLDMAQAVATFTEWVTIYPTTTTTTTTTKQPESNETKADGETSEETTTTSEPEDSSENSTNATAPEPIHRKKTHRVVLKIHRFPPSDWTPYNAETFAQSRRVLLELDEHDQAVKDTRDARNGLESYIFESRGKLYDDENVAKVTTEAEREKFLEILNAAENWIWDVEEETASVFKTKMREVRDTGDEIFLRAFELVERPKAFQGARDFVEGARASALKLKEQKPWLTSEDFADLENKTAAYAAWLAEKEFEQGKKALTDRPVVLAREIQMASKTVYTTFQKLQRRPKPKPKPKPKNGTGVNGTDFDINGTRYSQEDIERILEELKKEQKAKERSESGSGDGTEPLPNMEDDEDGDGTEETADKKDELRRRARR